MLRKYSNIEKPGNGVEKIPFGENASPKLHVFNAWWHRGNSEKLSKIDLEIRIKNQVSQKLRPSIDFLLVTEALVLNRCF